MPRLLDTDDVPDEILVLVVDFLQTCTLSQTCQRTWQLLQRRYTRYWVSQQNVRTISETLVSVQSWAYDVHLYAHSFRLRYECFENAGAQALAILKEAPLLSTLRVDLSGTLVGDAGAQALASLKDAPSLHTLSLDLSWTPVTNVGAQALASLQEAPLLRTLSLDLSKTDVGDVGAQALAGLRKAPWLHTLSLGLSKSSVSRFGAQALASLQEAPLLHTLSLDLSDNALEDVGAEYLGTLKELSTLQTLHLNLAHNRISWKGTQALSSLKDSATLHTFHLNLRANLVLCDGAVALSSLKDSSIHCLHLDLSCNKILCDGAHALATMVEDGGLRTLHLNLDGNNIRNEAMMEVLKAVVDSTATIHVSVRENFRSRPLVGCASIAGRGGGYASHQPHVLAPRVLEGGGIGGRPPQFNLTLTLTQFNLNLTD